MFDTCLLWMANMGTAFGAKDDAQAGNQKCPRCTFNNPKSAYNCEVKNKESNVGRVLVDASLFNLVF